MAEISESPQKNKQTPVFLFITLAAFVILLSTPRLFATMPGLLVTVTAIISLAKKETGSFLSFLILIVTVFLLVSNANFISELKIQDDDRTAYLANMEIQDNWKWSVDGDYSYIKGRVKNIGNKTVSYFKISSHFYDDNKNVIDTDYTNSTETLMPGMAKEFEIMHKHSDEYKTADIYVEEVVLKND